MSRLIALIALLSACAGATDDLPMAPTEEPPAEDTACDWTHVEACHACPSDAPIEGCFELAVVWRGQVLGFCSKRFACDAPPVPVTRIGTGQVTSTP